MKRAEKAGPPCRTCAEAEPHGWTNVYCTYFGIDINANYAYCTHHRSAIVEENEDAETHTGRGREAGREEKAG